MWLSGAMLVAGAVWDVTPELRRVLFFCFQLKFQSPFLRFFFLLFPSDSEDPSERVDREATGALVPERKMAS